MFLVGNPSGQNKVFQCTVVYKYNDQGDVLAIQESATGKKHSNEIFPNLIPDP